MAIRGYDKLGKIYVKERNTRLIASDGVEAYMAGKVLPARVRPVRYWLSGTAISDGGGVAPDQRGEMYMRAACGPMDDSQGQVETVDVTGDIMMARYMDPLLTSQSDTPETDFGITNDGASSQQSDQSRKEEFWSKKTYLGLPDKAVFTDANLILHVDKFRSSGKINAKHGYETGCFYGVGCSIDEPATAVDWGDHLWGNQLTQYTLYRALADLAVGQSTGGAGTGLGDYVTLPGDLANFLSSGYIEAGAMNIGNMWVSVRLTVECDVYASVGADKISMVG